MNDNDNKAYEALIEACENFVNKVDAGKARSKNSYKKMKDALRLVEKAPKDGTEKTVNNTVYKVVKQADGILTVKALIGVNGVEVIFSCLKIEWENDFIYVQKRLKEIVTNCIHAV